MRICIDSSVLVQGLRDTKSDSARLLDAVGDDLILFIPRLIVQEVTRNLRSPEQVRMLYRLFARRYSAFVVDEPIPRQLVDKYVELGLREKGDAFIGAFSEWIKVQYLVSSNRHFLRDLRTEAFEVLDPAEFMRRREHRLLDED
jgi:predicted nucleic acid-binding protein